MKQFIFTGVSGEQCGRERLSEPCRVMDLCTGNHKFSTEKDGVDVTKKQEGDCYCGLGR